MAILWLVILIIWIVGLKFTICKDSYNSAIATQLRFSIWSVFCFIIGLIFGYFV